MISAAPSKLAVVAGAVSSFFWCALRVCFKPVKLPSQALYNSLHHLS